MDLKEKFQVIVTLQINLKPAKHVHPTIRSFVSYHLYNILELRQENHGNPCHRCNFI